MERILILWRCTIPRFQSCPVVRIFCIVPHIGNVSPLGLGIVLLSILIIHTAIKHWIPCLSCVRVFKCNTEL